MTIKITIMAMVSMYLNIGGVKIIVFRYRNFFTVAPRSLVGPHFPYLIMALEGGNFTFTLASFSPIPKRNLYLDRIVFKI